MERQDYRLSTRHRKYIEKRFNKFIQEQLLVVEDEATEYFMYRIGGVEQYYPELHQEQLDLHKLQARSRLIKAAKTITDEMFDTYKKELSHSKENIFPMQWMLKDEQIEATLERYKYLCPLLNHLFNLNRRIRGEGLDSMFELNDEVTGSKQHLVATTMKFHRYASFIGDREFFQDAAQMLDCSVHTIKKYLIALVLAGIVKELGHHGRMRLYSDGYFTPYGNNNIRKRSFLKNSPEFVEALRNFQLK
jgi:hypothetical protein